MSADLCPTTGEMHRTDWAECEHCGYPTPEDRAAVEAMEDRVRELTAEEGYALFSRRCHDTLGVTADVFLAAHDADEYPREWDRTDVLYIEMLLPFAWRES